MTDFDLVICGAGPAGLAAAREACRLGLKTALIDEQSSPGGQIYRDIENADDKRAQILGIDYQYGKTLAKLPAALHYISGATIWRVEPNGRVVFSRNGATEIVSCKKLLLVFGALERPTPIKGWTLPGVMGVGAAQILLKSSGIIPRNSILAGSGPLLYLFAAQMARAGLAPVALVETQGFSDYLRAVSKASAALSGRQHLKKGLSLLSEIKSAGVKRYVGASQLEVLGESAATGLSFQHKGKTQELAAPSILLHQGVVPNIQASRALGLDHRWHERLQCFEPITNEQGKSSHDDIYIAGDGAGIAGAIAAEAGGAIAAIDIAYKLGSRSDSDAVSNSEKYRKVLNQERAFRPFIETIYTPPEETLNPSDTTIVCRCEEITAGTIRNAAKNGAMGPNQLKTFTRAGMGPCQGRYCGLTVNQILAKELSQSQQTTGYYTIRPPLKPVSLGELAAIKLETNDNTDL